MWCLGRGDSLTIRQSTFHAVELKASQGIIFNIHCICMLCECMNVRSNCAAYIYVLNINVYAYDMSRRTDVRFYYTFRSPREPICPPHHQTHTQSIYTVHSMAWHIAAIKYMRSFCYAPKTTHVRTSWLMIYIYIHSAFTYTHTHVSVYTPSLTEIYKQKEMFCNIISKKKVRIWQHRGIKQKCSIIIILFL